MPITFNFLFFFKLYQFYNRGTTCEFVTIMRDLRPSLLKQHIFIKHVLYYLLNTRLRAVPLSQLSPLSESDKNRDRKMAAQKTGRGAFFIKAIK